MHPSEIEMMKDLLKYAEMHQYIRKFIAKYSCISDTSNEDDNDIPGGLYIEALAKSLESALNPFREKILILEKKHIKNQHLPIGYFLTEIKEFDTLFYFLEQFIIELKTQRLFGCGILKLLHKYHFHADARSKQALNVIRHGVYSVFLSQLSQWMIFGKLCDVHGEFFIVRSDTGKAKLGNTETSELTMGSTIATEINASSWQFRISYAMIPPDFSTSCAEKVSIIHFEM